MADTKPAVKSLGVWGSLGAILSGITGAVSLLKGFDISVLLEAKDLLMTLVASISATIAGLAALWGRLKPQIKDIESIFKTAK